MLIAPVGLYLRRSLDETDAFQAEAERRSRERSQPKAPLLEIFRNHGRSLFVGFCVAVLWAVAVYVLMIYLPTYVQHPDTFNFTAKQAFGASLIGNVPFVIGCVWFGSLSDRFGRRRSLFASAALLLLCVLPLFMWLKADPTLPTLIVVQCIVCLLVASFVGVAPAALSEIFPTGVRSTGTSLAVQRSLHGVRRLRAHDSHLGHAAIGRVDVCTGLVRDAGRDRGIDRDTCIEFAAP